MLELADAFAAESMGNGLALSSVLGAVTGIEETSLDGYEGIVVIAREALWLARCAGSTRPGLDRDIPFGPSPRQAVDDRNGLWICHAHMVWLYPDQGPVLLMSLVDRQIPLTFPALV